MMDLLTPYGCMCISLNSIDPKQLQTFADTLITLGYLYFRVGPEGEAVNCSVEPRPTWALIGIQPSRKFTNAGVAKGTLEGLGSKGTFPDDVLRDYVDKSW